jgi:hypothetical protein
MSLLFSSVYSSNLLFQLPSFLREEWPSPPLVALLQAFPSSRLLGGCCHSCLVWPAGLFTVCVRDCPFSTLLGCGALPCLLPSFLSFFLFFLFSCLFIIQFFFCFSSWVGVSLSRGLCWSGPGLSVGVPRAALAHLVVCDFPSSLGAGVWRCRSPPGFSI